MSTGEWFAIVGLFFFAILLAWLGSKDRRWLFLGIAVYVIVPLVHTFGLPKIEVTGEVRGLYDFVEKLAEKKKAAGENGKEPIVLLTCDYDPGSKPELHPMTYAIVEHLCRHDLKFAVMELWPAGKDMAGEVLEAVARKKFKKRDRADFVHLGYKPGGDIVIQAIGTSIRKIYPTDVDGVPLDEVPFMQSVTGVKDFSLIINISAGTPGTKEWVQQAGSRYKVPIASGCTGVQAPMSYPYFPKQLIGLLGGMAAAAEYERLVGVEGTATQGMEAQSFSHALIILFVLFGNVAYFYGRRKGGASE